MTLKRMGELTKYSYSTNRECEMSLTLRDVSSEDNPADITKRCSVTVTPIRPDNAIDLASTESGDCDTVAIAANLDFGDGHPSGGSWTAYQGSDVQPSDGTTSVESEQPGAYGQSRCVFSSWVDYAHVSRNRRDVSTHGWWEDDSSSACPEYDDVKVWLQSHWCRVPRDGHCYWQTESYNKQRVRAWDQGGRKVNARTVCKPATAVVRWRSKVDVDLVGHSDPPYQKYSPPRNLLCNP